MNLTVKLRPVTLERFWRQSLYSCFLARTMLKTRRWMRNHRDIYQSWRGFPLNLICRRMRKFMARHRWRKAIRAVRKKKIIINIAKGTTDPRVEFIFPK